MRAACRTARSRYTHIHVCNTYRFRRKKDYAKAFQYQMIRTLLILFNFIYVLGEYAGFLYRMSSIILKKLGGCAKNILNFCFKGDD
jgi:hypothetical protein